MEQIDVKGGRAVVAKRFAKRSKARLKRREWKMVLKKEDESPRHACAYEGRYRGWMS